MSDVTRTVSTALQNLRQRELATRLSREIADASKEATTGVKANPYKSLGLRSADAIAIRMQVTRNEGFLTSNRLLDSRLELVESSLSGIRGIGQDILDVASLSKESFQATATNLAQVARAALDGIGTQATVRVNGVYVLSGTRSDAKPLQGWDVAHPGTGLSPQQIVGDIVGGGIADAADAQAKIDELKAVFDSTTPGDPRNFEESFYNGTPARDAAGNTTEQVTARISETEQLEQSARANDDGMRDMMRGLAMMASVEIRTIDDPAAYKLWMGEAVDSLSKGLDRMSELEIETGTKRGRLADVIDAQTSRSRFLDSEQLELEGADQYDAAGRLKLLQTQLEASYAITSRLSQMSFLNYM